MDARYSRTIASAERLGSAALDRHRFMQKRVLLTGESEILTTLNGREIARAALLLLIRICPQIVIALPNDCADLARELNELAYQVDPNNCIRLEDVGRQFDGYDAILSIGSRVESTWPWTVINSNGWLARVSSGPHGISAACDQANSIGAVGAACLGVAEVFKRLIVLAPEAGELLDNISFCFWTYSAGTDNAGPQLPAEIPVEVLLVGAGAIGSGTAYLLSRLPVTGGAMVIDKQDYELENWGTCMCIGMEDVAREKARVLADLLGSKLEVSWRRVSIEEFRGDLETENTRAAVVLNGLDEVEPRYEVQRLWPDLAIDGAIGSDFSCQVSCHPWGPDIACLLCLFRESPSTKRWDEAMSRDTGLPLEFFASADAVITEDHIRTAPPEKRAWLSHHIGRTWCSITPEEKAEMLSREELAHGFSPSVPFVACFSSCMIVSELVRYVLTGATRQEPRFQLNLLWGPQRGMDYPQARREVCDCVARSKNIERIRGMCRRLTLARSTIPGDVT
jgi:ThiF family